MKYLVIVALFLTVSYSYAQRLSNDWRGQLETHLTNFKSCKSVADQNSKCFQQIGQALHSLYQLSDFYLQDQQRYMAVSEIYEHLEKDSQWQLIGKGYEQPVLQQAQELANAKKAVIAIYLNEDRIGQLSYILPGKLSPSGSWGMQVPNSAAFITNAVEKSYVEKGLSYSFPRRLIPYVLIYTRKS
ncbi:MAG: hypothetical protein AAF944_24200 [Bacteroidota bacterium]